MSIRVVVADDQEIVREGFAALLGTEPDLKVVGTAADGEEAVRVCRAERPTSCSWTSACPASTASRPPGSSRATAGDALEC